ncbi:MULTISPECIES: HpcH/HpaI aldolase/citrate lyase family protein [unclassified Streptomyces]|uniref:HpcH/HpaI aldolase/citrate lyase family protein n=1 Tax=unclassified Streptomyces TaxID=2593676 RepID=UPI0007ECE0A0|nr:MULTISPECIES: HpcH/HpaI aldolase/citrate lyase family protein [unclassified Streptomyces]MCP3765691.1 HpcH/HpaI aldolase/citrate lyase family protein [Streptomyces sp. MAR25Y5]OBQ47991.1 ATP/GTP-binding protein [Streptomyces sp. H-KF8]
MHHFGQIAPSVRKRLFHREPGRFTARSPARLLAMALGATLYSPATRPRLADDIVKQAGNGVVSMVLCLEDSIGDDDVAAGEANLVAQFADLAGRTGAALPLLFIRVRTPEQIPDLVRRLGPTAGLLSGFVLPKFTEERGVPFLEALTVAEAAGGHRLFAMPVLESPELLYRETRVETLEGILRAVDKYRDRVLALRLGVTDFCSPYGLRRGPDMTAYDLQIVASVIADVVNMLGRVDGTGFTVTGPVWEYFRAQERMFKPQLRQSPFLEVQAVELRQSLIEHAMDGLLREISLDRANGLQGKTCIHPSHVLPVHALSVVSHEEYSDAQDILRPERCGGGVMRSAYTNKMNEVKPHRAWAERTVLRAEVFGVANEDIGFVELLAAGLAK